MISILQGDCREVLAGRPAESVQCVVTSPPYWGLRDYKLPELIWNHRGTEGTENCEHEWGDSMTKVNSAPPAARICAGCKKFGTTTWTDRHTTVVSCADCKIETTHTDVNRRDAQAQQGKMWWIDEAKMVGTRDYGGVNKGQFCGRCGAWRGSLGLEPTVELYVEHIVEVFRAVRRVLRKDGVMFLNMGDSYHGSYIAQSRVDGRDDTLNAANTAMTHKDTRKPVGGLKPKDLIGVPWRVAFALQADGWWLRSAIVWAKGLSFCPTYSGSVMPESCRDRPTSAYEMVFLLTKSARYYYDADAVREAQVTPMDSKAHQSFGAPGGKAEAVYGHKVSGDKWKPSGQRNLRNVWAINPQPFPEAHFATFPEALVEPCVKAGSSPKACGECGAPWERVLERETPPPNVFTGKTDSEDSLVRVGFDHADGSHTGSGQKYQNWRNAHPDVTTGWRPTCDHYDDHYLADFPRTRNDRKRRQQDRADRWFWRVRRHPGKGSWPYCRGVVLDPFGGSGTVGLVCKRLGRDFVGIELSEEYCDMARKRCARDVTRAIFD